MPPVIAPVAPPIAAPFAMFPEAEPIAAPAPAPTAPPIAASVAACSYEGPQPPITQLPITSVIDTREAGRSIKQRSVVKNEYIVVPRK